MATQTKSLDPPFPKEPTQARSRKALQRIYSATNQLLETKAFDQITVAEIANTASVAVGSIYQRFKTKDELLWVMYAAYIREANDQVNKLAAAPSTPDLEGRIEDICIVVNDLFRDHKGIVRSLLLKHRQDNSSVPSEYLNRIEHVNTKFINYLIYDSATKPDKSKMQIALSLVLACYRERILFGDFSGTDQRKAKDKAFRQYIWKAVAGILQ